MMFFCESTLDAKPILDGCAGHTICTALLPRLSCFQWIHTCLYTVMWSELVSQRLQVGGYAKDPSV